MARPRKATVTLASIDECQRAMRELLQATLHRERLEIECDREIAEVRHNFERPISIASAREKDLDKQLHNYYMAHLADLEKDGRHSVQLTHGVMGRRKSPAALKLLNKSWAWAAVREAVRAKWGAAFLRWADPEVDKDKVKDEIPEEQLADCGLKLHQEDSFYIELDRAATEGQ